MAKQKKLIDEHHYKIVLQQLAETEFLDIDIDEFDIESFSSDKEMFAYQKEALANALRVLLSYYDTYDANKNDFYYKAYMKYPHANLDFVKPTEMLQEYYAPVGNRIEFAHFVNRMSFWMTMGSGKTIVIIKLVELLERAMALKIIPRKNILFFTANEGLLDRFEKEVEAYNRFKTKTIETISLKSYEERVKYGNVFDADIIKLFCYRADLMAEETKENILDYKDVLNGGDNYVILDEAHKGDKQDSKRQNIFSILSQNGFLFNFSATFTDERDIATTVYNLNQAVWVKKGYGKKLFLLDNDLKSFKNKTDLNDDEKQKSLIKSLILLSFAKKHKKHISKAYHEPMMVVFTNSVNTDDADAKLFFRQVNRLCSEKDNRLFHAAKSEIVEEFKQTKYLVTDENGEGVNEFADEIAKLKFNEMKTLIFHQSIGNIEAIINPKDKGEIAFKLDSADKPFGLLKIGDTTSWKNDELSEIKITDTYKEESYFKGLDESSINILIGSRSFYEGWDTTRPNIMLFLNIGMDKEAKKFVTQSIGRGMRVESVDGSRQRLSYIDTTDKVSMKEDAKALETLFVISTNKDAIEHIVNWQEEQNKGIDWEEVALKKNELHGEILFVPKYKKGQTSLDKLDTKRSFKLSQKNKRDLEVYAQDLSEEVFSFRHHFYDKKEYEIFMSLVKSNKILNVDNSIHYKSLDFLIEKLKTRLYVNTSRIDKFKQLDDEIVHFRKIKVREDKKDEFIKLAQQTIDMQNLSNAEVFEKATEEGIELVEAVEKYQRKEIIYDGAKFLKLASYYYTPVVSQENSDWIKNIISVPSEVAFLDELVSIIKEMDKLFDWWKFSKLNEHYDKEIYIPYIENGVEKSFYPDFIFWLQKNDKQMIVFFDPKGMQHTAYEHKVDGYEELFEDGNGVVKQFKQQNMTIEVKLSLYNINHESPGKKYKRYWVDKGELEEYFKKIVKSM
jgi:phosphoribosyl-ATP pyrophosphohydrolase